MQPVPAELSQGDRHYLRSALRLGRKVIEHKLGSGIIVGVAVALILAALRLLGFSA